MVLDEGGGEEGDEALLVQSHPHKKKRMLQVKQIIKRKEKGREKRGKKRRFMQTRFPNLGKKEQEHLLRDLSARYKPRREQQLTNETVGLIQKGENIIVETGSFTTETREKEQEKKGKRGGISVSLLCGKTAANFDKR